jgi:hypothetical protein
MKMKRIFEVLWAWEHLLDGLSRKGLDPDCCRDLRRWSAVMASVENPRSKMLREIEQFQF